MLDRKHLSLFPGEPQLVQEANYPSCALASFWTICLGKNSRTRGRHDSALEDEPCARYPPSDPLVAPRLEPRHVESARLLAHGIQLLTGVGGHRYNQIERYCLEYFFSQ